jgi:hypothetical protein
LDNFWRGLLTATLGGILSVLFVAAWLNIWPLLTSLAA